MRRFIWLGAALLLAVSSACDGDVSSPAGDPDTATGDLGGEVDVVDEPDVAVTPDVVDPVEDVPDEPEVPTEPCGGCELGFSCVNDQCVSDLCPPSGPYGTHPGDGLTDKVVFDCDGNEVHLHELCGAPAGYFNLLAGW